MAQKNNYQIPKEERAEYYKFIQRANRRIKANIKYANENNIQTFRLKRRLTGGFDDILNWQTRGNPLSRSTKFESKEDYEDFRELVENWGGQVTKTGKSSSRGKFFSSHPELLKQDYKNSIINALNRTLINKNIPTENGRIPRGIMRKINSMSLEQLANFFGEDVDEEMENHAFDSDSVQYGDADSFNNYVESQLSWLEKTFPASQEPKVKKKKKRKRKKSKRLKTKVIKAPKPKTYIKKTKFKEKL